VNRATVVMAQKWVSMRFTLFSAARRSVQRPLTSAVLSATLLLVSSCRAEQPWPLWEKYSARYLDDQGRVIDHTSSDRSTTEGEAYAMFFALVTNDRPRFEKLLNWTESNLAQGDLTLHLPAWSWGQAANKSWGVLDSNSAADADLWMAYSLCEAGRLWHVDRYSKLGTVLAARIAQQEVVSVPSVGTVLLPGSQGFHPSPTTWYVNPSYLPPFLLEYFAHANPQSPWGAVLASLPAAVESRGGFAMDWMAVKADAGLQPSPPPGVAAALKEGETAPTPMGSFDAIRARRMSARRCENFRRWLRT
jgi:endo-1,4-beta-D-glucanase Y